MLLCGKVQKANCIDFVRAGGFRWTHVFCWCSLFKCLWIWVYLCNKLTSHFWQKSALVVTIGRVHYILSLYRSERFWKSVEFLPHHMSIHLFIFHSHTGWLLVCVTTILNVLYTVGFTQPDFKQIWQKGAGLCNWEGEECFCLPQSYLGLTAISQQCWWFKEKCATTEQHVHVPARFVVQDSLFRLVCSDCQEIIFVIQLLCNIYHKLIIYQGNYLHRWADGQVYLGQINLQESGFFSPSIVTINYHFMIHFLILCL